MRTLQKELEDLRMQRSREAQQAREDQAELDSLRVRCERMENGGMSNGVRINDRLAVRTANQRCTGGLRWC